MKQFRRFTALCLVLALVLSAGVQTALAADSFKVQMKAEFLHSDARKMLKLVNKFRTGKNAWYWAEDNKTKVNAKNLKELEYDYNLERVAMERALEIAVYYAHTRPDGSAWSTAYPSGYSGKGENIAYGYGSVQAVFDAFAEENNNYAGQGHRRNMLNDRFTRVGFGAVKIGNVIYWAQEFGQGGGKNSDNNRFKGNTVKVTEKILKQNVRKIEAESTELTVTVGDTVSAPGIVLISRSGARMLLKDSSWQAGGKNVSVKNNKVTGKKEGKTQLTAKVFGISVDLPVSVVSEQAGSSSDDGHTTIDDYDTPLGTEYLILLEDDECIEFEEE